MKKRILKIGRIVITSLVALIALGLIIFFLGPEPAKPNFEMPHFDNVASLTALEQEIDASEKQVQGLKAGNAANIVWADSTKKEKTKIALLYLHGLGASYREGSPVNINIAKTFGCNIFLARLAEHGTELGDTNFLNFTAEKYVESAEKALHIAKQLGDSVVIIATSGGAAMSLFLASRHPEIKGLVTYSPAVRIARPEAKLLAGHWGLQLSRFVTGKNHNDFVFRNPEQRFFWTNHQRFEGIIQFSVFLKYAMTPETFSKVKCPFFMAYYYKDEENQDKVVSVAAMKEMYGQLGTPPQYKREIAFPNADAHVITSDLTTKDWKNVELASMQFMQDMLGMSPKYK